MAKHAGLGLLIYGRVGWYFGQRQPGSVEDDRTETGVRFRREPQSLKK
jgi:hypothetical protein